MGETDDPRAALGASDVTTRSAAARDLARAGTWDDMAELVRLAREDKSSAVRLYAAAAAADIAARHRGAGGQVALDAEQRKQIEQWIRALDPGHNPGLLMLLSATPGPFTLDRLGRMLRDPRNGVRAGAAMALRRLALSGGPADHAAIRDAAKGWLASGKLPPDALLELVRIAGEAGWTGLDAEIRAAAKAGRPHVAAAEQALARLAERAGPAGWEGFYVTDGLDVLEIAERSRDEGWIAIVDGTWYEPGGVARPMTFEGGAVAVDGEPSRLVWAPKVGQHEDRFAAVQRGGRTWWRAAGKDLAAGVERWLEGFGADDTVVIGALRRWLEGSEGVVAQRARALLAYRAGDLEQADALFADLAAGKKPRPDVYYWHGRVLLGLGRKKDAAAALDQYLDKAGKKSEYRAEAEALRKKAGK